MLIVIAVVGCSSSSNAQASDPLAALAWLEGGKWIGEGKWPDGSALRVEVRYFWGPTKRVLHFETHDLASGQRKLLYEGLLFYDAKRGKMMQYNFKPAGELDESELSEVTDKGYEVRGKNTHSLVQYVNPNEFLWRLRVMQAGEWKEILSAKHRRER